MVKFSKNLSNRNMLKVEKFGVPNINCFWAINSFLSSGQKWSPLPGLIGLNQIALITTSDFLFVLLFLFHVSEMQ